MQWCKLYLNLLTNERFVNVSAAARGVYTSCIMLAAAENQHDGTLAGPLGAFSERDLARRLTLPASVITAAIVELSKVGLIEKNDSKALVVARFGVKETIGKASTPRVRAFRERKRNVSETPSETQDETFHETPDETFHGNEIETPQNRIDKNRIELEQAQAAPSPEPRAPQQIKFDDPIELRARELLELFWPRVEPAIGRALTKTAWKARNKSVARDFATLERSDADLLAAHSRATTRMGVTPYMLSIVADELIKLDNPQPERVLAAVGGGPIRGFDAELEAKNAAARAKGYLGKYCRMGDGSFMYTKHPSEER